MARIGTSGGRRARWLAIAIGSIALAVGALIPELVHRDGSSGEPTPAATTVP